MPKISFGISLFRFENEPPGNACAIARDDGFVTRAEGCQDGRPPAPDSYGERIVDELRNLISSDEKFQEMGRMYP